ncbi:MAG: gamma-glutamyltransferase [Acidobacteria bacterium]|nr:gamma-glutamyltransferase [Acidobacteriota bacterium]MCI0717852.1 gamma-glutamyltransferase [Acidobacteriota bacterium]
MNQTRILGLVAQLMLWLWLGCSALAQNQSFWRPVVMGTSGMVAAEHPLEARAGLQIMEAGGNAIDAALAVFYMTSVVEQHQAGIGGDAFVLAYIAKEKRVVFFNGTGPAPRLASRESYSELKGIPDTGPYSSTVPGAVAGMDLAWKRYGSLPLAKLIQPAIEAAERGHPLTYWSASLHRQAQSKLSAFPSSVKALLNNGRPFQPAEVFIQPDLARTLKTLVSEGAQAFYRGSLARLTADFYEQQKGLLRLEDLSSFEAEEAAPIKTAYKEYEVYQSAPNSQGITLLIALNILEGFNLQQLGHNSADYVHVITEALKLAFADRDQYIADPRFVKDIPVDGLLSKNYAAKRRALIRMDQAIRDVAPPGDPRRPAAILAPHSIAYEDPRRAGAELPDPLSSPLSVATQGETSSFSIADRFGNLVSATHSVNQTFGSGLVVEGAGYVLNNRMPYFSLEAADVNVLAPGKRPRHTINPALAFKNGKPFLAWNTPGGDNQPQAMLQAFLSVVEFGMNLQQAAEAATVTSSSFRASMYPQKPGSELAIPKVLADRVGQALMTKGHRLQVSAIQPPYGQQPSGAGAIKMVMIDPKTGVLHGGVSPAKDNYVMGW